MSVIGIFFGKRIGDGTIVIFASDFGVVAGKDFEGGGSIWLAGASGTTFAKRGFGLTNELELEADSGGFVALDAEDDRDEDEADERGSFNFRHGKIFIIHEIGKGKRTFWTDRGINVGSGTSTGSVFKILRGRNESLISCKKASASETFGST